MKSKRHLAVLVLFLVLLPAKSWCQADSLLHLGFDNTFLYERYAQRTELLVAQIVHYPVDSNVYINGIMLRADDDVVWDSLLEEFSLREIALAYRSKSKRVGISCYRDRMDPTQPAEIVNGRVSFDTSCILIVSGNRNAIWILHYATEHDASLIYQKLYNNLINHENEK